MNPLISGMRGAEIGATDFERVCRFYETVWTLRPLARRDGIATFAGAVADHPILTIVAGTTSARRIVWSARSEAALEELHGRIRSAGRPVSASHRAFEDAFRHRLR